VPYYYYAHPVELSPAELVEWMDTTKQLKEKGWMLAGAKMTDAAAPKELQRLLNKRKAIIETAGAKIARLKQILSSLDLRNFKHALVYASDKNRVQLDEVNKLLIDSFHLRIHQITSKETSNGRLAQTILRDFSTGHGIQVLTAMRVLDEGVDIPEIDKAFILASTTVERQWVQRRGRVLRMSRNTDKPHATIHDFFVVLPDGYDNPRSDSDTYRIFAGEMSRIFEFAKLSLNASAPDGALMAVSPYVQKYGVNDEQSSRS
jgi:superfamily II DNA or RNA helicase